MWTDSREIDLATVVKISNLEDLKDLSHEQGTLDETPRGKGGGVTIGGGGEGGGGDPTSSLRGGRREDAKT
jgi:hypothetical protein